MLSERRAPTPGSAQRPRSLIRRTAKRTLSILPTHIFLSVYAIPRSCLCVTNITTVTITSANPIMPMTACPPR